ncbi:MAG: hypothetical protein PUK09_04820, partial [Bacilli bacterium]|nr:hypothetical protein [Bacilli bacterium]
LVKMFYIDEENNEIFIKNEYKLSKVGSFKIKFTYFKDNIIYTAYCDIEVKELNLKKNFYEQNKIIILISASILILVIVIVLTLIKKNKHKKGKQNKKNSTPKRKK